MPSSAASTEYWKKISGLQFPGSPCISAAGSGTLLKETPGFCRFFQELALKPTAFWNKLIYKKLTAKKQAFCAPFWYKKMRECKAPSGRY
jgi:hypothetical protein